MNEQLELEHAALAMRRHADAILDRTHRTPGIPDEYAYTLLAVAGWIETEIRNLNARTRPFALAVARSFIHGAEAVA